MEQDINDIAYKIIGCAMKVHSVLGNCFQEIIYQRALAIEMSLTGLSFERELSLPIYFREIKVGSSRIDFIVENVIIVEIKARQEIQLGFKAQLISCLESYQIADGLLINFGASSLQFNRLFNNKLINPSDFS